MSRDELYNPALTIINGEYFPEYVPVTKSYFLTNFRTEPKIPTTMSEIHKLIRSGDADVATFEIIRCCRSSLYDCRRWLYARRSRCRQTEFCGKFALDYVENVIRRYVPGFNNPEEWEEVEVAWFYLG